MQTLRKKTSPLKYRNEPARFFGDGVVFKAKLIGILEVGEARGDRMCQEALQDLKIAIRAAGEHKQRITIHVTIEGLRLRDEKTGESLYHHPVHKISFIAQDMTDSRAFGYIFGSPDCGHRFFGIKTDKAASQVVLAMRDLFQCVFELKKKEIELAKQHIQNRITAHEHQQIKNSILEHKKTTTSSLLNEARATPKPEKSPETTANLVDLEQELSSIQRGITQMERITPNDDAPTSKNVLDDDPFGDSFNSNFSTAPFNILPPPAGLKSRAQQSMQKQNDDDSLSDLINPKPSSSSPLPQQPPQSSSTIDSWLHSTQISSSSIFKESEATPKTDDGLSKLTKSFDDNLDPLGTGKSKPYVDKKYFFQDLKNPPKKVLKDLSEHESIFDAHFSPQKRQIQGFSLDSSLVTSSHDSSSKIIDPFDDEDFSKINVDTLDTQSTSTKSVSPNQKSIILPDTKISSVNEEKSKTEDSLSDYKSFGSDMPGDSWTSSTYSDLRRQGSDGSVKNVFSVDSFSKKLPKPNLFGQRNVKRDSNGINMRRLQESDSLSENEPELPPRLPDTTPHEPPPLPPKNQKESSSENLDRHRYSRVPVSRENRYEYANKFKSHSSDSPPIPLPSRKINRTEISISSKSSRKSNDEDDYLTPTPSNDSFPQLPPPPASKFRGPKKSDTDPKNLDAPTPPVSARVDYSSSSNPSSILPDITLSQLLTLGIDDLAQKLNVPISKLNTMTLVELTTYLSEFIEKSKQPPAVTAVPVESPIDSPVFKVNFDDAVFEAKFDDNFGELQQQHSAHQDTFVANFDNFNQPPVTVIPTADRYAVFREIIDQDIQQQQYSFEGQHQESIESNNSNSLEDGQNSSFEFGRSSLNNEYSSPLESQFKQSPVPSQSSKIDNKITEALSGVKDRYAALRELRNIVLVEDLFDKSPKPPLASISDSNLSDDIADDVSSLNQQVFETAEIADNNSLENVPTYSVSWADAEDNEALNTENTIENQMQDEQLQKPVNNFSSSNKDDLEINEYMNKAISELSLDQRFSPNIQSKSPLKVEDENLTVSKQSSPLPVDQRKLSPSLNEMIKPVSPQNFIQPNDTVPTNENVLVQDPPKEEDLTQEIQNDAIVADDSRERTITPSDSKQPDASQSWAVFEQDHNNVKPPRPETIATHPKQEQESGSSDGKREWKHREKEYHKRWPKPPHTSSSSREASPWDEDPSEQRKRAQMHHPPPHYHPSDRYARPPGPRRRMNSHDEEYDEEYERRRMRAAKPPIHRSKEVLESDNWYHEQHWYPDEEEDDLERTPRPFDRNAYERNTYGPPYDKRDPRGYQGYDRRTYDKRSKYYRYNRPEYDYEHSYDIPASRGKPRKDYDDYEGSFERGARETRSAREYFYDRDRRSFDSNESYDSGRMHRMNSGELYGSHDSGRGVDYRDRDRYASQGRMSRRNQRSRGTIEDDSDELPPRRPSGDTGSLQRGQAARTKHSNIKLDDEVWGNAGKGYWKRPGSATAGDRMSGSGGGLSGSDGEREKRHRRKTRQGRSKEVELRSNYATIRYQGQEQRRKEYYDFEDDPNDEPIPASASPRFQAMDSRDYYAKKKQHSAGNVRTSTTPRMENKNFSEYVKPRYASPYDIADENFDDENRVAHGKNQAFKKSTSKEIFLDDHPKEQQANSQNENKRQSNVRRNEYNSEEQPQHPQGANKFAFDGFESDFTSSPKQQNDVKNDSLKFTFEEREFSSISPNASVKNGNSQQKLRFNENVSVSKFDKNASSQQMFEDDFLQSWTPETPSAGGTQIQSSLKKTATKPGGVFTRQDNIKKSDSVNIFARKSDEDPFANDDFFSGGDGSKDEQPEEDPFQWNSKNNFANFDDNKNI